MGGIVRCRETTVVYYGEVSEAKTKRTPRPNTQGARPQNSVHPNYALSPSEASRPNWYHPYPYFGKRVDASDNDASGSC